MEQKYIKSIYSYFERLLNLYSFEVTSEINEDQSYLIEFSSTDYTIKIEKYFREFYLTLYRNDDSENEISMFNLIEFLHQDDLNTPKFKSFGGARDMEECFIKQFEHLSTVFFNYHSEINGFFSNANYKSNIEYLKLYCMSK
jgi:hypothetical protein